MCLLAQYGMEEKLYCWQNITFRVILETMIYTPLGTFHYLLHVFICQKEDVFFIPHLPEAKDVQPEW